jgi:hypothetical protein
LPAPARADSEIAEGHRSRAQNVVDHRDDLVDVVGELRHSLDERTQGDR